MFTGQRRDRFTKVPSVSHGGLLERLGTKDLPLIPAIRVGAEPLCAVTQHSIGAEGAGPGPGPNEML